MIDLGTLVLGLRLDDQGYTRDLLAAERLARRLNNPISIQVRLNDARFLQDVQRANRAKDSLRGAVATEFRVNTTQVTRAQREIAEARREFSQPITQRIRVSNAEYRQDLDEARRAGRSFRDDFSGRSIHLPRLDSGNFERNLRATGNRGGDILTGIFQGIGQRITQVLTDAIGNGLRAGVGALSGTAREFADFDQQLNLLAVRTGESREELAEFEQVALRVGLTTSQLPGQAAAAAVELAQLGVELPDINRNLEDVVGAAEATGISITGLGRALQVGVNVFGDAGESIESLSDKFTVLANTTAVTSETDFLQFLSKAGANAQQIGVDFDELAAAFATVRDLGATPETAATGINSLFTRLRGTTDEAKAALDELESATGEQIKLFDELGNLRVDRSLFDTLSSLRDALSNFSDEDRLDILSQIFGTGTRAGAGAINNLLKGLETNYRDTFENLTNITGQEAERASQILISGFSGALRFIAGSVSTFQVEIGRSFNDLLAPFAEGIGDVLTNFLLDQDPLAPIRESSERLALTLSEIPGLGESINAAFAQIAGAGIDAVANALDGITQFLEANPTAVTDFVENFTGGFLEISSILSRVFGELGEILGPIAGTAVNLFQGLVDQGDLLVGVLNTLGNVLAPVANALETLSSNAFLVDTAFKAIIAANIVNTVAGLITPLISLGGAAAATATSLGAAAAAGNFAVFSAALAPVTALTGAFGALAVSAVAVAGPIIALGAAIAAVGFIKAAQDARVLNDEIEALANATNTVGEAGLQAANRLNNAIREGNEARAQGLDIDRQALQERIRLAELEQDAIAEQRRELNQQLRDVPQGRGFRGINNSQRESLENQLNELQATENALDGQIERANELLNIVTTEAVSAEADAANQINALGEEQTQQFIQREADKEAAAKERLDEIERLTQESNQRIAREESDAISDVLRQQLSGGLTDEGAQERLQRIQADTADAQEAAIREQIRLTQEAGNEQVLSAEDTAAKVAKLEARKSSIIQSELERQVRLQTAAERARQEEAEKAERERRELAVAEFEQQRDAILRQFDGRTDALQRQLEKESDLRLEAFEETQRLSEREFEFRERQLDRIQEAEKRSLEERQRLEQDAQNQRTSALERFVDRQLQLEEAGSREERRRLEEEFAAEDQRERRRRELQEEALRRDNSITRQDARARGGGLTPFEEDQRAFDDRQQAQQDALAAQQEAQQERLAQLREEQEERFAEQREALEEDISDRREALEDQIANDRRTLEDELARRREEAETGIQQDRANFAAEQRRLDIDAANEVARILSNARPQALTARRHGGEVGPGGSFLIGEAPHVGPEIGVFGGRAMLFDQPTILHNPPPGRIYSPEQTKQMMTPVARIPYQGGGSQGSNQVVTEIKKLRKQVGRIREVMPLLDALSQNLAKDEGQLDRDRMFENARWRLRGI